MSEDIKVLFYDNFPHRTYCFSEGLECYSCYGPGCNDPFNKGANVTDCATSCMKHVVMISGNRGTVYYQQKTQYMHKESLKIKHNYISINCNKKFYQLMFSLFIRG